MSHIHASLSNLFLPLGAWRLLLEAGPGALEHSGPVDSFKVFTSHIMHGHYPAWCARDVHTRAFSLHPLGHNIYMGNYLTITRGNDIKTNQPIERIRYD